MQLSTVPETRRTTGDITLHRFRVGPTAALTWVAGVVGAAYTAVAIASPRNPFTYFNPGLHIAVEVFVGLIALLAAYLIFGRLRHNAQWRDLALTFALLVFGLTSLLLGAVPAVLGGGAGWVVYAAVLARLLGAVAFGAAALAGPRFVGSGQGMAWRLAAAVGVGFVLVVAAARHLATLLPEKVLADLTQPVTGTPDLGAHPVVLAANLTAVVCYALAAVGFGRRASSSGDQFMASVGAGSMFASFAAFNYMLYPSLYNGFVSTGDMLRVTFYVFMTIGASREIRLYWQGLAEAAVLEERRRMARDLHDGVAQELTYIANQTKLLTPSLADAVTLWRVTTAAERALDESRRAIAALTQSPHEPLDVVLAQAVEEVADRVGVRVRLNLEEGVDVVPGAREGLLRIAREAVANAGRHSKAGEVVVHLDDSDGIRLRVSDDGVGFDPSTDGRAEGYGLVSMRERAESLDAEFRILSYPGLGTSVEVVLP